MDDATDNLSIIHTRHAMGPWKVAIDAKNLSFTEPKVIRHEQVLLAELNQKSDALGILKINRS